MSPVVDKAQDGLPIYYGIFHELAGIFNSGDMYKQDVNPDNTVLFIEGSECEWYDSSLIGNPYHVPCAGSVDGENSVIQDKADAWSDPDGLYYFKKQYYWEENCYFRPVQYYDLEYTESYDDSKVHIHGYYKDGFTYRITTTWAWENRLKLARTTQHKIEIFWCEMQPGKPGYWYSLSRTFASKIFSGENAPLLDPEAVVAFAQGPGVLGQSRVILADDSGQWNEAGNGTSANISRKDYLPGGKYYLSLNKEFIRFDSYFVQRNRGDHVLQADLRSQCYVEAMQNFDCNTNNIANIMSVMDIISAMRSFNIKKLKNIPAEIIGKAKHAGKTASETWLSYRYVYNTTLSDVEEITRFVKAINNLSETFRGGKSTELGQCRVKVRATNKQLSPLKDQLTLLEKYGIAPDLYNIWDLVPYSFIVDWFIDVGGLLEQLQLYGKTLKYDINSITTSFSWSDVVDYNGIPVKVSHYERLVTTVAPPFLPYSESTGAKAWLKRIVDGISLFVGRL